VGLGIAQSRATLSEMNSDLPPEQALISPDRLAEIIADIDRADPPELEALLTALTTAAWPSRFALEH
jgi:hypothetical protein